MLPRLYSLPLRVKQLCRTNGQFFITLISNEFLIFFIRGQSKCGSWNVNRRTKTGDRRDRRKKREKQWDRRWKQENKDAGERNMRNSETEERNRRTGDKRDKQEKQWDRGEKQENWEQERETGETVRQERETGEPGTGKRNRKTNETGVRVTVILSCLTRKLSASVLLTSLCGTQHTASLVGFHETATVFYEGLKIFLLQFLCDDLTCAPPTSCLSAGTTVK